MGTPSALEHIATVARAAGLPRDSLRGDRRDRPIAVVRAYLCWWLRTERGLSSTIVGRMLHRDHTAVLYAAKRWEGHWQHEPMGQALLRRIGVVDGPHYFWLGREGE